MKNKQRTKIVSIDHLNKNFEAKITSCPAALKADLYSNVTLPLPKGKFSAYFEVGDEIEFKKRGEFDMEIVSLSCEVLRLSRFKRELNSILKRLDSDNNPLKRCILLNEAGFVLLSAKKNKEKLMLLHYQLDIKGNHEKF